MKTQVNKVKRNLKQSLRRRQRGNTLVPVVIGLGIAGVATVSFLNQGEGLIADNNRVLASNEVASTLKDYNAIRAAGTAANDVTAVMVPGLTANNVYATAGNWVAANTIFSYTTDSAQTCQQLLAAFTGADGVTAPPAAAAVNTTNCSDANGAAPNDNAALNVILNLNLN